MTNEEIRGDSPNLAKVVKYIVERSKNIKIASDKLRENILAIEKILQPAIDASSIGYSGKVFVTYTIHGYLYDYQLAISKSRGYIARQDQSLGTLAAIVEVAKACIRGFRGDIRNDAICRQFIDEILTQLSQRTVSVRDDQIKANPLKHITNIS